MASILSLSQNAQSYVPSDSGSEFAKDRPGVKVRPYSAENRSTRGQAMTWDNPQWGGGSFMKFDDSTPPPSVGA